MSQLESAWLAEVEELNIIARANGRSDANQHGCHRFIYDPQRANTKKVAS